MMLLKLNMMMMIRMINQERKKERKKETKIRGYLVVFIYKNLFGCHCALFLVMLLLKLTGLTSIF